MKIRIVCYEDLDTWILGKFAKKLNQELHNLSIESDISKTPDPTADINHHIIYYHYLPKNNSNDTLMITHVDSYQKLLRIKNQLKAAKAGICMSADTMNKLIKAGIPKEKLFYINPAHDGVIKPKTIVLGITSKVNDDKRKKQDLLTEICKKVSPDNFSFKIMGSGWDKIVTKIKKMGFNVEYYPQFDYQQYVKLIPSLDYYLYFSFDEGSMGFLDALSAGVKTIVTPQGYHLDAPNGITYSVKDLSDIVKTLHNIVKERQILINSVSDWTWENYAKKHVDLWRCILNKKNFLPLLNKNTQNIPITSPTLLERTNTNLNYFFKPLTIYNFLWNLTPSFIKNSYRKKYEAKYQK